MPIYKQQANPLDCEFLCNKFGIADKVLQGSYSEESKWFSGRHNLLKTSVCLEELVPAAEDLTET